MNTQQLEGEVMTAPASSSKMKKTPLYAQHVEMGAKMVPFAGYEMPVSYSGIVDEHLNVRKNVGVFDVSHMGEFIVEGPRALDLLQYATSNDVSKLFPGRVQYSCLPNEKGGIIDDLLVYNLGPEKYLLVVNASNIEKDFAWLEKLNQEYNCTLKNLSDDYALIAVQGPLAAEILQPLTSAVLKEIPYYHFKIDTFAGIANVIISNTGYTGAGGFELYCRNKEAAHLWKCIFDSGKEKGIKPAGLGCRDTLRLEMGFCLYGNDIDDTTSPLEAGLGWITSFSKDFVARPILEQQKKEGLKRKLVGLTLSDKNIPRHDFEICNEKEEVIGKVTSGTMAPSLNIPIAMGYVKTEYAKTGSMVKIKIRNKLADARVSKLPFYHND